MCSASGGVGRGYFLDEDCQISAFSVENIAFDESQGPSSLDVFKFVDSVCTSCAAGHGDVCENLYNSSFHCSDRYMTAVAVGESTSWRASQQSQQDHSGDGEDADDDDYDARQMEFADEVCYKTSTYNQKKQYQVHSASSARGDDSLQERVLELLMVVGIAIMSVGLTIFLFLSYKYHARHSVTFGSESLCSASIDTDSAASR